MELEEVQLGQVYYEGVGKEPWFIEQVLDKVNADGTINTNGGKCQTTISSVERWNKTKESAIYDMIIYWTTIAHNDMSNRHEFYRTFVKEMGDYIKINYPEFLI